MPSSSKIPRITRKHSPTLIFSDSELRHKALDKLLEDFLNRCAYSLVHVETSSKHNMEVDHHNPTIKGRKRNVYRNLYPAFSLCNNHKRKRWPTKADLRKRLRFLDPCKEADYNDQLFEDPLTGELLPTTPEAVYHIENCGLNHPWFNQQRLKRSENERLLKQLEKTGVAQIDPATYASLKRTFTTDIPTINPLPPGTTAL